MKRICFILGTRPEIIKLSPIIRQCINDRLPYFIIHTNQHYSPKLDKIFFKELELPSAKYNLNIGSAYHGQQTGNMIIEIEKILKKEKPSCILIQGDTNSVLAGAMAAAKEMKIQIAHIEAGLRSYDRSMPEEINRIIADHVSDLLFAPTIQQKKILLKEGIPNNRISVTGNTIVDAVLQNIIISDKKSNILNKYKISKNNYCLLTLHRPANVDNKATLKTTLEGVSAAAKKLFIDEIIFPIHPRTQKSINKFKLKVPRSIKILPPLGYIEMLQLISNAKIVFTDSGGIQEETCILKIPCVTLRENTERPETLVVGGNILAGNSRNKIISSAKIIQNRKIKWSNPFGDGKSAQKIINVIRPLL